MTNLINIPMPLTVEEIGAEWLTAALRTRVPDASVNAFEISRTMRGACTKIWLKLDLNEAAKTAGVPETVVLKGGFEPHSRALKIMHECEALGYRDIFPELKLNTPACYFADYDDALGQGIVIMEDLTARGVTFCNALKPLSHEEARSRLSALAQYHAKSWNSPEFAAGGRWAMLKGPEVNFGHFFDWMAKPEIWQTYLALPRAAATSVRFHDPAWARDALERIARLIPQVPVAIVHGDSHLGNLYVEKDGAPGFLDSLPIRSAVMQEIAYHMTGVLDVADRRRWEGALVRHYLNELARAGVEPPDFDDAMSEYSAFLVWGFLVWLFNDPVWQSEAVNTACAARFSAAMLDNDTMGHIARLS